MANKIHMCANFYMSKMKWISNNGDIVINKVFMKQIDFCIIYIFYETKNVSRDAIRKRTSEIILGTYHILETWRCCDIFYLENEIRIKFEHNKYCVHSNAIHYNYVISQQNSIACVNCLMKMNQVIWSTNL